MLLDGYQSVDDLLANTWRSVSREPYVDKRVSEDQLEDAPPDPPATAILTISSCCGEYCESRTVRCDCNSMKSGQRRQSR